MKSKKILSLILAAAMLFSLVTSTPASAAEEPVFTVIEDSSVPPVDDPTNIIVNGGFESEPLGATSTLFSWKPETVWDNTQAIEGNRSMKIGASLGEGGFGGSPVIDLLDHEALKLTFYVKAKNFDARSKARLLVYFQKAAGQEEVKTPQAIINYDTPGIKDEKWVKVEMYIRADEIVRGQQLHFMRFPVADLAAEPDATLETHPCPDMWIDNVSMVIIDANDIPKIDKPTPKPTEKPDGDGGGKKSKVKAPKKLKVNNIKKIRKKTKKIKGTTNKKVYVKVVKGKTVIGKKRANKKGKFTIKVNFKKYKVGTKFKIYAYRMDKKKEVVGKTRTFKLKK